MVEVKGSTKRNGHASPEGVLALIDPGSGKPKAPTPEAPWWAGGMGFRLGIAVGLVGLAFLLPRFVEPRAVDPGRGWLIIEPLAGVLLFWPLSRAFVRSMPLFFALFFAVLPALILLGVRLYGSERSIADGTHANTSFGTMIFLGVCSLAAYFLFGRPPRHP